MDPVLTRYVREPNGHTLDFFLQHQGYEGLKKALAMKPDDASMTLAYVQALRGYWTAHYRLRRVTLFDFEREEGIK